MLLRLNLGNSAVIGKARGAYDRPRVRKGQPQFKERGKNLKGQDNERIVYLDRKTTKNYGRSPFGLAITNIFKERGKGLGDPQITEIKRK